ncbi:hypothetical protein PGT21_027726 [Puccinia graminis f. sp. tritici]|uniref:Uncharacterized protein n=2 Tax=Puccinia graminis f. sp. tritici TaxID=56615 RepID=A0A5B0PYQ3_PUCGR|nr:hypothetical protein PGT21_027726 [Puccinia graminis f. sp. tritici]
MVYFTLVTQPNRTSNFVNQLDSGSILKIRQSSRFRINTQASSIFSFQAQLSSPLERRWILSSSSFFVVRGHSWNSQGVKRSIRAFKRPIERLNAQSSDGGSLQPSGMSRGLRDRVWGGRWGHGG